MTNELGAYEGAMPFLLRFAERVPRGRLRPSRYNVERQISQVLVEGQWVDAPDAPDESVGGTRVTDVRAETTDDM